MTPGSDDDAQCLTFWLVVAVLSSIEGYAKVILSQNFPPYFYAKCLFVAWLLFNDGAEKIYRRLIRRILRDYKYILDVLRLSHGHMGASQIKACNQNNFLETIDEKIPSKPFAKYYDPSVKMPLSSPSQIYYTGWSHQLDDLSVFYSHIDANKESLENIFDKYEWWSDLEESLLDWKSFNPRYLQITLLSADNLPDLDKYEVTDPYAVFTIRQPKEPKKPSSTTFRKIRSTTKFNTLSPVWNESFEIRLMGGTLDESTGYYRSRIIEQDSKLDISFYDEDGHYISLFLRLANLFLTLLLPCLLFMAFFDFPYITTQEYLDTVLENKNSTLLFDMCDIGQQIDAQIIAFMRMDDGRISTVPLVSFLSAIILLELLQRWWQQNTKKDELIGQISIDLKDLMDQKEHLFTQQPLFLPCKGKSEDQVKQEENEQNRGEITFAARLSE